MKTITVKISDADYADLVAHFAADKPGRPLVAVIAYEDAPLKLEGLSGAAHPPQSGSRD